ncbi:MAG TPA: TetR/AcrR family transcriptional regulator [Actinomycetes bacterium]|jgi:AcrR family transcriptional regulator|nr:TetR/AcrR family transcriptional regulator [Actinomycetes bacterium]
MPKQVDHQARRRRITDALLRITSTHGLQAVSLREVAAEAGVSMGQVQHYFHTKDQMLAFAVRHQHERITQRIQQHLARAPDPRPARVVLHAMAVAMLPLDDQGRAEASIWLAFLARATVQPSFAAPLRAAYPQIVAALTEQLRRAQDDGELPATCNPQREADILFALVQGLLGPVLLGHYPPETAMAIVDHHLDRLFTQPQAL